jgi:glycosyltransferase involved in cell wall biosynthesis
MDGLRRRRGMSERLLVVLPGYNVARHLPALVAGLRRHAPGVDLCLVDDGSSDGTAEAARGLGLEVRIHPGNRGKGEALKTGFAYAVAHGYDAVLTLDADGQHLPEEVPRLIERFRQGADVVIGSRMHANAGMPWLRKRTNEFTSAVVSRLASARIPDSQSGFRLIATSVLRAMTLQSSRYDLESEVLIRAGRLGYSIASVPITTVYQDQHSSIHPLVDTLRFFRLVGRARRWRRRPGDSPPRGDGAP